MTRRYWSFPEFKEIFSSVLKSQRYGDAVPDLNVRSHYQTSGPSSDLDNNHRREAASNNESILEYVNFPDPQLYLIGFESC